MKASSAELYNLQAAKTPAKRTERPRVSPRKIVEDQIRSGFVLLRFKRALETDFCGYLRESGRLSRVSLLMLSFMAVFIVAVMDHSLIGIPDELVVPLRIVQLGFILPIISATAFYCWFYPNSRLIEPIMLSLFLGMVAGLLVQRIYGVRYGFDMPVESVGVAIASMFSLARIRFWVMLPASVLALAATTTNEIWVVNASPNAYAHLFTMILLVIIGICGGYSSEYFIRWTWLNNMLLRFLSRMDSLTGLLNRSALEEALERAQAHARREGIGYALAMVDIDAFGAYNDHYGHQHGDNALRRVAGLLDSSARRPQDVCGRYGGEEFVVLWMQGDAPDLCAMADSTRVAVEQARIPHAVSPVSPWVTVSIGLCYVDAEHSDAGLDNVLRVADELLYEAKENGRNRVICEHFTDEHFDRSDADAQESNVVPVAGGQGVLTRPR